MKGYLLCLTFDESHVAFTSDDFCAPLHDLYNLRFLPMQLLLLTGQHHSSP
jgi:hypothetical protein